MTSHSGVIVTSSAWGSRPFAPSVLVGGTADGAGGVVVTVVGAAAVVDGAVVVLAAFVDGRTVDAAWSAEVRARPVPDPSTSANAPAPAAASTRTPAPPSANCGGRPQRRLTLR